MPVRSTTVEGVPGQLAAVDDRRSGVADRARDVLDAARIRLPPGRFGARRDEHTSDRGEHLPAGAGERRDAHADRIGALALSHANRRPGFGRTSVSGPGQKRPDGRPRVAEAPARVSRASTEVEEQARSGWIASRPFAA